MEFVCRSCGARSSDKDKVLDGACSCGGTHFQLVSEENPIMPTAMNTKEEIRRDLHTWIDLNIDSMDPEMLRNMRVVFEMTKQ